MMINESRKHPSPGMIVFNGTEKHRPHSCSIVASMQVKRLLGSTLRTWFTITGGEPALVSSFWNAEVTVVLKAWSLCLLVYLCLENSCDIVWSLWVMCQNFAFYIFLLFNRLKTPKSVVLWYLTHWRCRRCEGISSLNVNSGRLKLSVKAHRFDSNKSYCRN